MFKSGFHSRFYSIFDSIFKGEVFDPDDYTLRYQLDGADANLTLTGTQDNRSFWEQPKPDGKCAGFNGSTYYTSNQGIAIDNMQTDFTITFWINTSYIATSVIFKWAYNAGSSTILSYVNTSGNLVIQATGAGNAVASTKLVADGNWHFCQWNQNGQVYTIKIDNVVDKVGTLPTTIVPSATSALYISTDGANKFQGFIDDWRFYDRKLSTTEDSYIYNDIYITNPNTITSPPDFWIDSQDTTTITDTAGNVTQWDDKSTNNWHVTPDAPTNEPTTNATKFNLLNVVDFTTDDFLRNDNVASILNGVTKPITIIDFSIPDTLPPVGQNQWVCGIGDSVGDAFKLLNGFRTDNMRTIIFEDGGGNKRGDVAYSSETSVINSFTYDGTTPKKKINGGTISSIGSGATGQVTCDVFVVGAIVDAVVSQFLEGSVQMVAIYSFAMTEAQVEMLEGYAAWMTGTTGDLPVTHTYKNSPVLIG